MWWFLSGSPTPWTAVGLVAVGLVCITALCGARLLLLKQEEKLRGRKMSFVTDLLVYGAFPDSINNVHYTINCVSFFKHIPSLEDLKRLCTEKLLKFRRFRSVPDAAFWRPVDVSIDAHVWQQEVADQAALDEKLRELTNKPLSRDRPRWEVPTHLSNPSCQALLLANQAVGAPSPSRAHGRERPPFHAMVFRVDHGVADGVSLVEVLGGLLTDFNHNPLGIHGLVGIRRQPLGFFVRLRAPWILKFGRIFRVFKIAVKVIMGVPASLKMSLGRADNAIPFTRSREMTFSSNQEVVMAGPYSLDFIRKVKSRLEVSVNEVFMAAFAGAVRRYCEERGEAGVIQSEAVEGRKLQCRALVPFAFMRPEASFSDPERALTNKWSCFSVKLATNEASRVERLRATRCVSQKLKRSLAPLTNLLISMVSSYILPRKVSKKILWETYSKHSVMFGNVPGPAMKVRLCRSVIEAVQILFAGCLPQVEIFTYAGQVLVSFVAARDVIADPKAVVDFFVEELRGLGRDIGLDPGALEFVTDGEEWHSDSSLNGEPSSSVSSEPEPSRPLLAHHPRLSE